MTYTNRTNQLILLFFSCWLITLTIPSVVLSSSSEQPLDIKQLSAEEQPSEKQIVGWIENIKIFPGNLNIRAKLDTGAKHSSLNATNIKKFKRDGDEWVRFSVINKRGVSFDFEEKVIRYTKIKEFAATLQIRPVIRLWFCIGGMMQIAEVNLTDRSHYNYQVLIGRSFLAGRLIIDPEKTFTVKPSCQRIKEK